MVSRNSLFLIIRSMSDRGTKWYSGEMRWQVEEKDDGKSTAYLGHPVRQVEGFVWYLVEA